MSEQKRPQRRPAGGGGPFGHMGSTEKAKDLKGTLKKLGKYLAVFKFKIYVVIFFAVLSTVFMIVSPKILGNVTNSIQTDYMNKIFYKQIIEKMPPGAKIPAGMTGADIIPNIPQEQLEKIPTKALENLKKLDLSKPPEFNFKYIRDIMLLLFLLYIMSALFMYIQGYIISGVAQKVSYNLRKEISEKINRMPLSYFDTKPHGDVLSRVTNDVDTISNTLNQSLSQIITSVTSIIGILIMMISISWSMTGISLLILPLSFVLLMGIVKKSQKYFVDQQKYLGTVNGHVEEMYGGHSVMKVFNGEEKSIKTFEESNEKLFHSAWKSQFLSGLMMPISFFVGNLGYVAVCAFGGYLAINGKLNIGDILSFIIYVRQFTQPIAQMSQIANIMQSTAAAAERVFEFLAEEELSPDKKKPAKIENPTGLVEFKDVVFGYKQNETIIKNFSAKILPGHKVAIVGPTGAGKTTLVNLLMRFYEINSGDITIDGISIKDMDRDYLRDMIGMVLQDTWLFSGSIKDNIAYGKATFNVPLDEIEMAAKTAKVDHFIHTLSGGYEMEINEEASNISQGQKQLLTIARAVISDPKILILDEATSSVDTRTEVLIQKAMANLMKNRTSFVIAHRLSTIKDADLIFVMKDGNIVEQGNHRELLDQKGFYSELYQAQFAGKEI